jgi:predicted methyltransferase
MALFRALAAFSIVLGVVAAPAGADGQARTGLEAAVNGDHRTSGSKARNEFRHPLETLAWFGIAPEMTVIEISPGGGGWYTEILAPFLRDHGKLYAASYNANSQQQYYKNNAKKFLDKLAADPSIYDQVTVTVMSKERMEIGPDGAADMVLTFRNVHNWINGDYADAVFSAMYKALKPGGVLGLTEHRGDPSASHGHRAASGYVTEDAVIGLARRAGFRLLEKSEINANPKDTKDHPKGVWTLPPSYRLGDTDRAKYAAIGESDRMTFKFEKPRP